MSPSIIRAFLLRRFSFLAFFSSALRFFSFSFSFRRLSLSALVVRAYLSFEKSLRSDETSVKRRLT